MEEGYVISKKDFKKYFDSKNVIDKSDFLLYKNIKNAQKYVEKITQNFNYFLTT